MLRRSAPWLQTALETGANSWMLRCLSQTELSCRQRIEHARRAINNRLEALMKDQNENGGSISEHIALRDALTTLAELQKIAYARKPTSSPGD
jgi:hypothetical protein